MQYISERDAELMNIYIGNYAGTEESDCGAGQRALDDILAPWFAAKQDGGLFKMFGEGNLILEKEVEIETPEEELRLAFGNCQELATLKNKMVDKIGDVSSRYFVRRLFYNNNLISNKLEDNYDRIFKYGTNSISWAPGMKTTKMIRKVAEILGLSEEYEAFRLAHSRILNAKTLKGTLCLSIHPMDYMTMSDNTYNWSSCMSWRNGGCYRSGTLEMMNSPKVIVAYLRGEGEIEGWHGNKKWRTLVVVDDALVTSVKGYPYQCESLACAAVEWVRDLANAVSESKYAQVSAQGFKYRNEDEYPKEFHLVFQTNGWMYNDFGAAMHYYIPCTQGLPTERYDICYGGTVYCLSCGCELHAEDEGRLCCWAEEEEEEEYYGHCEECGEDIYEDDDYTWVGGILYCQACFNRLRNNGTIVEDFWTRDWMYFEDAVTINIFKADGKIITVYSYYRIVQRNKEEWFGNVDVDTSAGSTIFVPYENCSEELLKFV